MSFFARIRELVCAYRKYDPATNNVWEIFFLYPGIRASLFHEIAHFFYSRRIPFLPRFFSELSRFLTGIDIHPGARFGRRVIMDHGMGIVIGETAIVGNDVLIYQGVTLGGTSLERSKRHPTIEDHCVIGGGAKVLGNITVGQGSRIGANSVVVKDVPAGSTVVGVPGKIVSAAGVILGKELEHGQLPDPVQQKCSDLESRLAKLEKIMAEGKS
ncbi:MAG: serine O-acetyltransferase [Bdellovibrionales bacterium]|nr:serine O-acetyltransferase [Bdellovibrionales bacterium]